MSGQIPSALAGERSSLSPLRHRTFAMLWTATVVSNIGTWMQNAAASWLMTGLDPDPLTVALVQVATTLPMFVFALPAGALADIVDRRRLLLVIQIAATLWVAGFGLLVWSGRVTPGILLGFSFLAATFASLVAPAWQSIVPSLVPRQDLQAAVALNSVGINISRAVGPALAGVIIAGMGMAAPFWLNALAAIGVIAALTWWRPSQGAARRLPPERFGGAIRAGLRHAGHNPHLRATLIRAAGFFVFASAYWALLPLVAREQVRGGPTLYGILLGAIGAGAVGGAFLLPWLKRTLGADRVVIAGTVGTALALFLFGVARHPAIALAASLIAGVAWIAVLATLNVSAQVALPEWVRGRGLSIFATVMFAGLALGSALWGQIAVMIYALAGARALARDRSRPRTGAGDHRVQHPAGTTRRIPGGHREARTGTAARRRLQLVHLRGCRDGRTFRGNLSGGLMARALASARARDQCRPRVAGSRSPLRRRRGTQGHASGRRQTRRPRDGRIGDILKSTSGAGRPSRIIDNAPAPAGRHAAGNARPRCVSACNGRGLLLDAGEDDFDCGALPLRSKRRLVVGFKYERAPRIDRVGAEDTFIVSARHGAGLAALSFDETNACSTRTDRACRSRGSFRAGRSLIALVAFLGCRRFPASGECQHQNNDEPASLHDWSCRWV